MNILVVQETDWIDRNPIQHHHLLEILSARGHRVTVIDFPLFWHKAPGPLFQPRQEFGGVSRLYPRASVLVVRPGIVRLPLLSRLSWLLGNRAELERRFAQDRPDVVIGYGISNAYLAQRMAHRKGIPFVFHVLDALHTLAEPAVLRPLAAAIERRVFVAAGQVIVANRKLMEYAEGMGARKDGVTYLPAGADLHLFRADLEPEPPRRALAIEPEDHVLLFMGWLYSFCGLREIVSALPEALRSAPAVRLLVVGQGPLMPELERLRDALGLSKNVLLLGQRPYQELPALIAAADVCLLPFEENAATRYVVPMKLYDYLAAGRPVVANRLPGVAAEFSEEDGVLTASSPGQLLATAVALARDRERARHLGAAARRRMEANGDWEAVASRFESLLLACVGGGVGKERLQV